MDTLKLTEATICMGHFEIEGFQMYRGAPSHDGLEPKMFDKFDMVFSGHYHHKSSRKNIHYLGNPYELTWQDYDDPRGCHIFDLKTHELEFIQNPNRMFIKIVYDDKLESVIEIEEFYSYNKAWIKSVVVHLLAVLNVLKPNIGFILLFILL